MYRYSSEHGLSTLVTHLGEAANPYNAHVEPIYQTSTFNFPDVATGAGIVGRTQPGYYYTRLGNPNLDHLANKLALLEALDLLRASPGAALEDVAAGQLFASGMAAVSAVLFSRLKAGDTIIAQDAVYSNTFNFLQEIAPRLNIQVAWVNDVSVQGWEAAFAAHPHACLAYAETPANPTMAMVDLAAVAEIAHRHGAWLAVDNTFATPYCQRPLTLGADIVLHSTTKFLSGHGTLIGGAVVSRHPQYIRNELRLFVKVLGGTPSPFDAWLSNLGLKTFELRMQRHCENALAVARWLETHPAVAAVYYPGLESHPAHAIALRQMHFNGQPAFGGMLAFELKGGLEAGVRLMERVAVASLAVSLGNVDTLIQHPASMTHAATPPADRLKQGITDGLVRLSVGIENVQDVLADLEQGLKG